MKVSNNNLSVGIIGNGAFGSLLSRLLAPHSNLVMFDNNSGFREGVANTLKQVAQADIIFLAVNLKDLEDVCNRIKKHVPKTTEIVEVCSVKIVSSKILRKHFSGVCGYSSTHPLFGPQSIALNNNSTEGMKIVVCREDQVLPKSVEHILVDLLKLQTIFMNPVEHDKQMAWVHGLTFFVGRSLLNMNLEQLDIGTHYFEKLLELVSLEKSHSEDLFMSIQRGNPFADDVRRRFIESTINLNETIGVSNET